MILKPNRCFAPCGERQCVRDLCDRAGSLVNFREKTVKMRSLVNTTRCLESLEGPLTPTVAPIDEVISRKSIKEFLLSDWL